MIELIAETAWHHERDFDFMTRLTQALATQSKADIIKCHLTLDRDEYLAKDFPNYAINEKNFGPEQWEQIFKTIRSSGKKLMTILNDRRAVDFVAPYQPELVEVHAVCLNDVHLLRAIRDQFAGSAKVVLGVGGSTLYEIEAALDFLGSADVVLMFGFQNYPTRYQDVNFNKMKKIMRLYPEVEFGYADHTGWDEPYNQKITLMGASLGMRYVEKHTTIEYGQQRTDWQSAISIEMLNELYEDLQVLDACNGDGSLRLNAGEQQYGRIGPMKKAPILASGVQQEEAVTLDKISFKRTKQETDLSQLDVIKAAENRAIFAEDISEGTVLFNQHLTKQS